MKHRIPFVAAALAMALTGCAGYAYPPASAHLTTTQVAAEDPPATPAGDGGAAGSEGATTTSEGTPPPAGGGEGGGGTPPPPPTFPGPETPNTNTLVDLQCPDGACLDLAITSPHPGQNVHHFEGGIYKGGTLVATFSLPASGNLATLHVGNMGSGLDYHVKLSAYDNAGHRINMHAPGVESYGPFKPYAGQCLTDSVAVPTLPMPSPV